jgi:hypothetical protein
LNQRLAPDFRTARLSLNLELLDVVIQLNIEPLGVGDQLLVLGHEPLGVLDFARSDPDRTW